MKRISILTIFLFGILFTLKSAINVSGTISQDSIWTLAESPYTVTSNLTISSGVTLTVDSGVVVEFNTGISLTVRGNLDAYKATFTSSQTTKQKGDWNNIIVGYSSNVGNVVFDGCVVEYGGYSTTSNSYSMVRVDNGLVSLINGTELRNSNNGALMVGGTSGDALVENSIITSSDWPIVLSTYGDLELNGLNDLTGNNHDGIFITYSQLYKDLYLDTASIPYYINSSLTINTGYKLEIASGNIIKTNNIIYVNGSLKAVAGLSENIYFTTTRDDNLGGDTNNDGAATTPASKSWYYIIFNDASDDANSMLKRCVISYGGAGNRGAVITVNASPTIDSCEFANNYYGAEFNGSSYPNFRYNTIASSEMVPIALTFDADPVFQNNAFSFSDNEYDAIGLLGSTLVTDAYLHQRDVTGIPNVTYLMLGTLTIPENLSLVIEKGIVIKGFNSTHRIIVKGTLVADGEDASNMIIFTSSKDDNHGNPGDTNKDGTQSNPEVGNWGGIVFEGTSSDTSLLNFCQVKYGEMPSVYYNSRYIYDGAITTVNASPTISNCIIKDVKYGIYAFQASDPVIQNNEISNSVYTPIALSVSADPTISGNNFLNTGWTALGLIGENLGTSGTIKLRNVAGYDSISYILIEDLTINSGTYVDVDPGVVIKSNLYADINVNGGFQAAGTSSDTIVFTSIRDDNYGNPKDTEQDGDATSPDAGNWGRIVFNGSSDDSYNLLDYCKLLYGGYSNTGAVTFVDAGGTLKNTLISDAQYNGIRCEGVSTPDCSDNIEIKNCGSDPIAMSLKSDPVFSFAGVKMKSNGNASNGIRIIEGTLSSSDTLRQRDVGGIYNIAYIVYQLTIGPDATLTLEPGVVIKFYNIYSYINVNGALIANGTPTENIVFTSLKDDSKGGDTNDDGNESTPQRGDWWSVYFNSSTLEANNILNNCILNYGGRDQPGWSDLKDYGTIRFFDSYATIDSCMIEQSNTSALGVYGSSNPAITNCEIHNVNHTPVSMSMFSTPSFSDNTVSNLGIGALGIVPENYSLDATIPVRNFAGYTNITYFMYRACTINSGTIITVPAGIVFKHDNYDCFDVEGGILVKGETGNPVIFTHEHDDAYGNPMDTNEDGDDSNPTISNNKYGIDFADISNDTSMINHAIFRYSHGGINLAQASPTIKNSTFDNCNYGVILRGVSEPGVDTCTFSDLTYTPIILSLVSYPVTSEENVISGSTYRAIGVLSEELVQDVTLEKKDFAGIENIPYYFSGDYSIGTSVVLTVNPGLVLKFNQRAQLEVYRGLIAEGGATPDSIIVFTDYRDDFYGGDTNADSVATTPSIYNWAGIYFDNQSLDASCILDHCVVRYAGYYSNEAAITTDAANPTITNSAIIMNKNGIRTTGASNPLINYCDIYDNTDYGVNNVNQSFNIDARYNWWGSPTGPTHSSNPGGTGDVISDMVNYADFITVTQNPMMGDISLNGKVQAYDASLLLQHIATTITLTSDQLAVADVSDNGGITAYDASLILQYVAGAIDVFPAELKSLKKPQSISLNLQGIFEETGNGNIEFTLSADNIADASALQFEIDYDTKKISVLDIQKTALTNNMIMQAKVDQENGKIYIAMAEVDNLAANGNIFKVVFNTLTYDDQPVEFDITNLLVNEYTVNEIPFTLSSIDELTGITQLNNPEFFYVGPNPVTDQLNISFTLIESQNIKIEIFDLTGKKISDIINKVFETGTYNEFVNIKEMGDGKIQNGQYLLRFTGKKRVIVKPLLIK